MTDYDYDPRDLWDMESQEDKLSYKLAHMRPRDSLEGLYVVVVARGYRIDVRDRNNPLLIKGQWTKSFRHFSEACYWALEPSNHKELT